MEYRDCGVPEMYSETPMSSVVKASLFSKMEIAFPITKDRSLLLWIHVAEMRDSRQQTLAYLIRSYLDAGQTAKIYRLPDLVDKKFDKKEWNAVWSHVLSLDCMVLEIANDYNHKVAPEIFKEVVISRKRSKGLTIIISEDDIAAMVPRYGETMCNFFGAIKKTRKYING